VLAAGYFFNKNQRLNSSYTELKKKLQLNLENTDAQRFFHKRINALIKITTTKNSPPAEIITAILKLGCDIFGTEDATLFIKTQPRSELKILGSHCSVTKPLNDTEKTLIANSIVYLTSKSPNPILINNVELEPNHNRQLKTVKSYIGIKIEVSNNIYGVLCFYSRCKLRTINSDDYRLIDVIKFSIESIAQRQFSGLDRMPATNNVLHL
jgi:GAF domain-containing protein